mmetsp:Transcript_19968/g.56564  ORF Transcript_19968/g.56564 Transcript_19968/m.56564 type:complete len:86 (+) Transcript_19968:262-519(+)
MSEDHQHAYPQHIVVLNSRSPAPCHVTVASPSWRKGGRSLSKQERHRTNQPHAHILHHEKISSNRKKNVFFSRPLSITTASTKQQ